MTASDEFGSDGSTVVGGVQYDFDRFSVRGEYEWFDATDDVEAQRFSVTAIFRF